MEVYKKPVELKVSKISHDGGVTIKFNQALKVPNLDSVSRSYGDKLPKKRQLGEVNLKDIIYLEVDASDYTVTLVSWTTWLL